MWTRNSDTGKWTLINDVLSKESYDSLKQDLMEVKLYSKCLSGSTYLPINNLDNIYDQLDINKIGWYFNPNIPTNGSRYLIDNTTSNEFYNKYLEEDAFTIKNLFTPTKLINDAYDNFLLVDVATTEPLTQIGSTQINLTIDGVRLVEGHRVLVKDQVTQIRLNSSVDPVYYFTNVLAVATYSIIESDTSNVLYEYWNNDNGIYEWKGNKLVKNSDLDSYESSKRFSISTKLGTINRDKQFHSIRLLNGYYPVSSEGDNIYFAEKHNWILRNRVDYNNIYDLNYYDILHSEPGEVWDEFYGRTYSIPSRTIAVGEFGIIINNQDKLSQSATWSKSHIIDNKSKVNLRSIVEVDKWYWICGDSGTLLRVSKIDFSIKRIELNETSNLMSISFFGSLNGVSVGKFNTFYFTNDGGDSWEKVTYSGFDLYSYNRVVHRSFNEVYVGGESGVFIEFNYSGGNWIAYKRKISKYISSDDEYILVEDINDMYDTSWTQLEETNYTEDSTSIDFLRSLKWNNVQSGVNELVITIDSDYFVDTLIKKTGTFSLPGYGYVRADYSAAINIVGSDGSVIVTNWDDVNGINNINFFQSIVIDEDLNETYYNRVVATFSLPLDSDGNLKNINYTIDVLMQYNYDGVSVLDFGNYFSGKISYQLETRKGDMVLISTNNDNVIVYDVDNLISPDFGFIYLSSTQSHSDIQSITRRRGSSHIYISGEGIWKFNFVDLFNLNEGTNFAYVTTNFVSELHVNRFYSSFDYLYLAGNNSLLQFYDWNLSFYDLDPSFGDGIKSKMVFLDYDIASKLNFFDDNGDYRVADSITFSMHSLVGPTSSISFKSISGEKNWIDYYKDSEKTFMYYSSMSDSTGVEFSSTFSYVGSSKISETFTGASVSNNLSIISYLAPNIGSPTASRFISGNQPISSNFATEYSILLNKYLAIFKVTFGVNIGDVIQIRSNEIDCNLVVNRIERYIGRSGNAISFQNPNLTSNPVRVLTPSFQLGLNQYVETYIYCYSNFNENIIRNLRSSSSIRITNLNLYDSIDSLILNIGNHTLGFGYKLEEVGNDIKVNALFNNKTAYYNMATEVNAGGNVKYMTYKKSFLDFGWSPTYNLLGYLSKIDPQLFTDITKFSILPEWKDLKGNNGGSFTGSNIYIDLSEGTISSTFSYWRNGTNKIIFGNDFKLEWESLLKWTFVDLTMHPEVGVSQTDERLLITDKYYDDNLGGWVMEFHRKIEIGINPNNFYVWSFDIRSRNTLGEISDDLNLLNNIQRSSYTKSVQPLNSFTILGNELKYKFPTESYFKALVSDNNIRSKVSSIIYTDRNNEVSMNILNIQKTLEYNIVSTSGVSFGGFTNSLRIDIEGYHELEVGNLVNVNFTGGTSSSEERNPTYFGLQTIIQSNPSYIITSVSYNLPTNFEVGKVTYIKKDPFLNYQPIDLFNIGSDHKATRSVEIKPENYTLDHNSYKLINLDLNKYKIQFVDGLSLEEVSDKFNWLLEAEISNAIIGRDESGIIWYSGTWNCGRWFGGQWISGRWVSGDWYGGTWSAFNTKFQVIGVQVDTSYVDNGVSKWYGGRWFGGTWKGGTWYDGRRYAGDWMGGLWWNGIWNDGHWFGGAFQGGIWVAGKWESGQFNCDSKPAYWLDGQFLSGDFQNGIWYNGEFGNDSGLLSRFGTRSTNSRTSTWHGGTWKSGEFHSFLNLDSSTGNPVVSDVHKLSIWRTGKWLSGDFWGGIAYNIDFRSGNWNGGILEEIQVIGIDSIFPATYSTNSITLNGIFKFNLGDEIWIIDDDTNYLFSPIGSNDNPMKYRINGVTEDSLNEQTTIKLNYNLSSLFSSDWGLTSSYSNIESGLRVVSYFKDSNWVSGIWTNGIFDGGNFNSGIWYNGILESGAKWGN